ncbi:hypothetical protein [Streptomyces sp. NPDC057939]|uniref:hypothetical protein n=1 Tax=Streptomyces sp. NPDC057939 TaxID=3346284 RepID=UPI0036EE8840
MTREHTAPAEPDAVLATRALTRESGRARRLLAAEQWTPSPADAHAAGAVLARLTAPLPTRKHSTEGTRTLDRDRRLQRILRSAVHHLDAGSVSPSAAALLAAVARALLPWHAAPTPSPAAAAPRYGVPHGTTTGAVVPPTEEGEALLPDLIALFTILATPKATRKATPGAIPNQPGTVPLTPPAEPWQARYTGRFRHYGRPSPGVWTARTFTCPRCGSAGGPWTVTGDWRQIALACPCGTMTNEHGLTPSEVWLCLPDT